MKKQTFLSVSLAIFICGFIKVKAQTVNTFPYYENFEATNGGYTFGGSQIWTWGTPAKTSMNVAGEGAKSWVSGPLNQYVSLPLSGTYLETRPFDFTNVQAPFISFKFFVELENNWMGVVFEASVNNGAWTMIGTYNEPNDACNTLNWYNDNRGAGISWSGALRNSACGGNTYTPGCGLIPLCGKWNVARHCLTGMGGKSNVKFRWRFVRNAGGYECDHEGFAIDSVSVSESTSEANFTNNSGCAGTPFLFNSTPGKCGGAVRWNFGDGSPVISAANPVKIFNAPGTYQVKMLTAGSCGKQDTLTRAVTVLPTPPIIKDPTILKSKYCISDAPVTLAGSRTPAGGTFFINGVSASVFNPTALGVGDHTVIYIYTEPSGNRCTSRDTQQVRVYVPTVSIDSLGGSYCLSSPVVQLKGSPAGGIFTVNGTPATSFSAAALGLGNHIITYVYSDPDGCVGSDTRTIEVVSNIVAQINGLSSSYCSYEPPISLSGSPVGGSFTIDGNPAFTLNPASLSAGVHRIIYSYSDGGSCGDRDTADITIVKVTASINNLDSVYCYNSPLVGLSGNPLGGDFFVDGNPAFSFNPASLSVVTHKILYVYTDPVSLCIDSVSKIISIDKPVLSFTGINNNYCKNSIAVVLKAAPVGGSFKLDGVSATEINPTLLDTGFHNLVYSYTNPATGCVNSTSKTIYIAPLPKPYFVDLDSVFCITSDLVVLHAEPLGGAFTINNLPVQMLDPSVLSLNATHIVAYQYVDQNFGCVASVTQNIKVVAPPSVTMSGIKGSYCLSDSAFTPAGSPTGGIFIINDTNTVTNIDPALLGKGIHKITYYFQAANGCDAAINQQVTVLPAITGSIEPDPVSVCSDEEIELNFNGTGNIIWNTGNTNKSIRITPAITTYYWVKSTDCVNFSDSVLVTVKVAPKADFSLSADEGLIPFSVVATAHNISTPNILWMVDTAKTPNINPFNYRFNKAGQFAITLIVDSMGCTDTLTKLVNATEQVVPVKLPNVFTPDNDGINDDFGINPDAQRFVKQCSFQVFNRWGNLLFETTDPYQRWNGTDKGTNAPDGVYFFVLNASLSDDTPVNLTGSVQIIRGNQ
jgi:gliding motility-associated-like protein